MWEDSTVSTADLQGFVVWGDCFGAVIVMGREGMVHKPLDVRVYSTLTDSLGTSLSARLGGAGIRVKMKSVPCGHFHNNNFKTSAYGNNVDEA